ncbi:MAG TPA: class I SAM-dependent methyltransferase [Actinomycetota bacterium]|nr:class I SAM-dependent methyltransferase [Actinomycetota bacterium]
MTTPRERVADALAGVERLYTAGCKQYGPTPRSVGWRDEESQRLRFAKLAQVLDSSGGSPVTVNDLGCGYASFFTFLDEVLGRDMVRYNGYDLSEAMVEAARRLTDDRANLVQSAEATEVADYSFASGPFNVKGDSTYSDWRDYVEESILQLAGKSQRGLAFNLLTTFVDYRQDDLFYGDPAHFLSFCKSRISRYVTLLHDYPLYEWTMLVHFEPVDAKPSMRRLR